MFKIRRGRGSEKILTAQQVASSIFQLDVEKGGFICGRMAYMSGYKEAIKFTTENELVEALNQYVEQHDMTGFGWSVVQIYFINNDNLLHFDFEIPKRVELTLDDMKTASRGDKKALKAYRLLHKDKSNIKTKEPAQIFLL